MTEEPAAQAIIDREHLRLLALGYRISGGISIFIALFGLLYLVLGVVLVNVIPRLPEVARSAQNGPPPAFVGWILGCFGLAFFVLSLALAAVKFWVARCLDRREGRLFCQVVAVVCCLGLPYGTILGAFTFIVLSRPTVRELYGVS